MEARSGRLDLCCDCFYRYCGEAPVHEGSMINAHLNHVRLRRVLDYISANLANELTLADLAGIACLSPYHFARTFTRAMGVSPHRYVSQMRLQKAMAEVAAGKLPLVQIALNARFSSQASFTRAFRRATGLSPGGYRRRQV
jgi:AraC family transcriptional regulator